MKGRNVKIEIIKRDLSQTELAQRIGISLSHLNLIINGHRRTRWTRKTIAKELGLRVKNLFENK
ncbi:MAG: helix-turn-helix transcriptional regulator [Deltaproteobacteria bacterium]|nr:MAG: helix-turn-helix transcriptional regulator [Deltaproteobacteria bacterium]